MIFHQQGNSGGIYNYNAYIYQDTAYEPHFHKNFELIYVLCGEQDVMVNGVTRTLSSEEAILIAPNAVHSFAVSGPTRIWVGVFSKDFVTAYAKKNAGVTFSPFRCRPEIRTFLEEHLFTETVPELYTLIACLYLVCGQCAENAAPLAGQTDMTVTDRVIRYAAEHYMDDISLRSMADALKYEYHYFSKVFHDCLGMNFKDFINIYRVEAASELLAETELDFTQIAMKSGFQSIRTFNRVFKKLSGLTPGGYRSAESGRKVMRIYR